MTVDMTGSANVLIYGSPYDPHVSGVAESLTRAGGAAFIVSPISDWRTETALPTWLSNSALHSPDSFFDLRDEPWATISVCWMRNKFRLYTIESPEDQRREFESATRTDYLGSILRANGTRVVNSGNDQSFDKGTQIRIANKLGARIPPTIITDKKQHILEFLDEVGTAIVKPFSRSYASPVRGDMSSFVTIPTSIVSPDEIRQATDDEIGSCPAIYQQYIEKEYELRVIAFGEEVVGFKINSQQFDHTRTDWRKGEATPGVIETHPFQLPTDLEDFVRVFLKRSGLDTGVFDFIISQDGGWIFLECNPNGQWAALDGEDYSISDLFSSQILCLAQADR